MQCSLNSGCIFSTKPVLSGAAPRTPGIENDGAAGNLATEDLVYMLHGMGYKTGIDLPQLIQIKSYIEKMVGRDLPSHVGRSGLSLPKTINSQI